MKYVIEYDIRTAGLTHDQNFDNQDALLKAFGKWSPEEGLTINAFLSTLNNGGYVFVEADDPGVVYSFVSKFTAWIAVQRRTGDRRGRRGGAWNGVSCLGSLRRSTARNPDPSR